MKYKIGELASLLNVSTNMIRRYENKGHIQSKQQDTTKYRFFDEINALKFIDTRLLRKYGFSHAEIETLYKSDFEESLSIYENKVNEIDRMINYYSHFKKRLNNNINLLQRMEQPSYNNSIKDCTAFTYILYQSDDTFLNEKKRLKTLHNHLDKAPEVFRIYIAKKSDLDQDIIKTYSGLAVKTQSIDSFHLMENEYTVRYEKQLSLMHYIKVPLSSDKLSLHNKKLLRYNLIKKITKKLAKDKLRLNGDILFLVVGAIFEQDRMMERIIMNIPVVPINS